MFYVIYVNNFFCFSDNSSDTSSQKKRKTTDTLWTPWKKHTTPYTPDKLVIPLPVPHPAVIAVTINNRDTDDPIPLESEICQNILRGIEESQAVSDDKGLYNTRFLLFFLISK